MCLLENSIDACPPNFYKVKRILLFDGSQQLLQHARMTLKLMNMIYTRRRGVCYVCLLENSIDACPPNFYYLMALSSCCCQNMSVLC